MVVTGDGDGRRRWRTAGHTAGHVEVTTAGSDLGKGCDALLQGFPILRLQFKRSSLSVNVTADLVGVHCKGYPCLRSAGGVEARKKSR